MSSIEEFLDEQLVNGRSYFSLDEAVRQHSMSPQAFAAAARRLIKKQKLIRPRQEFFVIQRPEDRIAGPDPVKWIDGLMKYQKIDYRISLLSAAAHHGSSHQAAMVFQLVVPKQLRGIQVGRHRLQFVYQKAPIFNKVNRPDWLSQIKSDEGFAKVAGVELTLLDSMRYYGSAGGIDGVAQMSKDIGGDANPRKLAQIAACYENSTVRRLGYLLERVGHERQAHALLPFAAKASSIQPLNPSVMSSLGFPIDKHKKDETWRLDINQVVEIDS